MRPGKFIWRNMAKRLHSVFTEDMDHCFFRGTPYPERHHIFGGPNKARSEKYGFIIPLHRELHPNGAAATQEGRDLDILLKQMAQRYYEEHIGSREEFIKEFIRSYL